MGRNPSGKINEISKEQRDTPIKLLQFQKRRDYMSYDHDHDLLKREIVITLINAFRR